ncbi:hypothetical protein EVAR_26104_1 [Eumeta japonica]|uniref:Uncharacterized protein n=1 Tax=Eumeta variegata TaxID=151549 RepID=A0A4C1WYX9_EUMVA|nr:hypothetical protein EVAR_26104_1 [Eumeta japonica]
MEVVGWRGSGPSELSLTERKETAKTVTSSLYSVKVWYCTGLGGQFTRCNLQATNHKDNYAIRKHDRKRKYNLGHHLNRKPSCGVNPKVGSKLELRTEMRQDSTAKPRIGRRLDGGRERSQLRELD